MPRQRALVIGLCGLLVTTTVVAASTPMAVSPGDPSKLVLIVDACPTFSWGQVDWATSYELVVYQVGEEGEAAGRLDPNGPTRLTQRVAVIGDGDFLSNNYLGNIINFSVLSDEFEDEYSETNRGEIYRIIATVIEIVRIYHENHEHSDTYEFTGEFKDEHESQAASIRSRLYYRYAQQILNENWVPVLEGNKVTIYKRRSNGTWPNQ